MIDVIGISESGCNNILRWAISNGVNPKTNSNISALINDEMYYNIQISNVNFYELFRITQYHHTKIKILKFHTVDNLSDDELMNRFYPEHHADIKDIIDKFLAISTLIREDDDINDKLYSSLILPMITTKCDIQFPIGFGDILSYMAVDDSKKIFTNDYPENLNDMIKLDSIRQGILLNVDRSTRNITYNDMLDKLIQATKYKNLPKSQDKIYKTAMLSFEKEHTSNRRIIRNSLFNVNRNDMINNMKIMSTLNGEMKYTFAVQLPIYLMQTLESVYDDKIIEISMRSSVGNLLTNNFFLDENIVKKYGLRITESMSEMYQLMLKILENTDLKESVIALLPPAQYTNALITISDNNLETLINESNPYLQEMFLKMEQLIRSVNIDIQKVRGENIPNTKNN